MANREFDVVLYGAAGFTGRQAVTYFKQHAPPGLRWAIAGRNRSKLEALAANVPVIVADSANQPAIDGFVRRTRIVLSTAGPFELYSDGVVDACVRFGSHYVDITGETLWVRTLIDRYHDPARVNGTRIIPFCGFDSVPSDLGAMWLTSQLGEITQLKAYYEFKAGSPNGGTIATGLHTFSLNAKDCLQDPFLLSPGVKHAPSDLELDPSAAAYDCDVKSWVAPFIMSSINTRVVRRSCFLLGKDLAYQEFMKTKGAIAAHLVSGIGETLKKSMESSAIRRFLQKVSPRPGAGPSEQAMNSGWFRCEFFGRANDGRTARAVVAGEGDPANRITVKCVCESALALACDERNLPDCAGVITPSTGLGDRLLSRLRGAGITFSLADSE